MKKAISLSIVAIVLCFSLLYAAPVSAVVRVRGYTRSNGTYVQPYFRSNSNSTKIDNYSTYGNYNPYTGKKGTRKYF